MDPWGGVAPPGSAAVSGTLFSIQIAADGSSITAAALSRNTTGSERSEKAIVTIGSLQLLLTVTQKEGTAHINDYVTIFNYLGTTANLGDELFGQMNNGTPSAVLNNFLKNETLFGLSGTLPFGGFALAGLPLQTDMSYELADIFDIILLSAGLAEQLTYDDIDLLKEWSTQRTGRFIISYLDNENLINRMGLAVQSVTAVNWQYTMTKAADAPDYIFKGPFGSLSSLSLNMSAIYNNPRVILRNETNNPDIVPLMVNSSNTNEMVVALDTRYNIIYWGNFNTFLGFPYDSNFSATGNIQTDADKLLLNIFAWMLEVYYGEKLAPVVP